MMDRWVDLVQIPHSGEYPERTAALDACLRRQDRVDTGNLPSRFSRAVFRDPVLRAETPWTDWMPLCLFIPACDYRVGLMHVRRDTFYKLHPLVHTICFE